MSYICDIRRVRQTPQRGRVAGSAGSAVVVERSLDEGLRDQPDQRVRTAEMESACARRVAKLNPDSSLDALFSKPFSQRNRHQI